MSTPCRSSPARADRTRPARCAVHHEGGAHELHRTGPVPDDDRLAALVAEVRASVARATSAALDELARSVPASIEAICVRAWSRDFPTDIATLRKVPFESRADSVMYCQTLADVASERGWDVRQHDARTVEAAAAAQLGTRAHEVLHGPRTTLGPPWTKDHRLALAATIVCG